LNMVIEQFKLITIYLLILPALTLYIGRNRFFVPISPNSIDVIPTRPEIATPQQLLHFRMPFEYLFSCNTFYGLHNVPWTQHGYTLYQKMYMFLICSNFHKMYLVPLVYPYTYIFQCFSHLFCNNLSSVFCRTDNMIQKKTFVMPFVNMFTHTPLYPDAEHRGILLIKHNKLFVYLKLCCSEGNSPFSTSSRYVMIALSASSLRFT
jgi:hypothetical protein